MPRRAATATLRIERSGTGLVVVARSPLQESVVRIASVERANACASWVRGAITGALAAPGSRAVVVDRLLMRCQAAAVDLVERDGLLQLRAVLGALRAAERPLLVVEHGDGPDIPFGCLPLLGEWNEGLVAGDGWEEALRILPAFGAEVARHDDGIVSLAQDCVLHRDQDDRVPTVQLGDWSLAGPHHEADVLAGLPSLRVVATLPLEGSGASTIRDRVVHGGADGTADQIHHVACHGQLDPVTDSVALVLRAGDRSEAVRFDRADALAVTGSAGWSPLPRGPLTVLNACDTAWTRTVDRGGLPSALLVLGHRAVVGTHVPLTSEDTHAMAHALYRTMWGDPAQPLAVGPALLGARWWAARRSARGIGVALAYDLWGDPDLAPEPVVTAALGSPP